MKKAYLAILTTIALITGSSVLVSPASAAVFPFEMATLNFTVGDITEINMGCQEDNIIEVHFDSGSLPPGLTMDSAGMVTGTLTTPGEFRLDGYTCSYNGGSNSAGWPNYYLIFQVNAAVTPVPVVQMFNLNTENCSFYTTVMFPETPDAGAPFVEISNQTGTVLRSSTPGWAIMNKNQLYTVVYTIADLNNSVDHFGFLDATTKTGDVPFSCGDTIIFTAGYQYRGAPVATAWDAVVVDKPTVVLQPGSAPQQKLIALDNAECEFRVIAALPTTPLSSSTKITISQPGLVTNQVVLNIQDSFASGIIDFTFDPETLSAGPHTQLGIASGNFEVSSPWSCGTTLSVSVEYKDLSGTSWTSISTPNTNKLTVTPTRAEEPAVACNAGTIASEDGLTCTEALRGFYTTALNSTTPIACAPGMTTATTSSKSINDCYKPIVQTITGLKAPKAMKYGSVTNLAITTNTKAQATFKVSGPCTAKVASIVTKVKGKKVTTKMLKVTTSKKAGNCSVTLTSVAKDKYLAMSKSVKIKVSKTGK